MRPLGILALLLLPALGRVAPAAAQDEPAPPLSVTYVDPLEKVLREAAFFPQREATADVARGEHASLQFALRSTVPVTRLEARLEPLRSGAASLPAAEVGYVGYVRVGRATPNPARDRLLPPSGYYPDPILDTAPATLPAHTTQPVWVTVPIPKDAAPGLYRGQLTVTGEAGGRAVRAVHDVAVRVYPVVVDRTRLWVTNWFTLDPGALAHLDGGRPVAPYSDTYWRLARVLARKMAAYRQNVALLSPLRLAEYRVDGDRYTIDFTRFDRMVQLFIDEGVVGRIEGGHLGGRASHWTSPFVVSVPVARADTVVFEPHPIASAPAQAFYRQFLPALVAHLKEKGWLDRYVQHLADEPIEENADSYIEIARFVEEQAPELKIVEACHSRNLAERLDVWVPQLDFLHKDYDFYAEQGRNGSEVWFYTCLAPQGEYANRFIEQPLLKTRILHWMNFRYDVPGYLHWGLNFWNDDPFDETTGIITESGNVLPGGDAWIVYPAEGRVLSSIRLEAMRDGIVDYELLRMLEAVAPDDAREVARLVVYDFTRYDTHVASFREKRREILERLSRTPAGRMPGAP